MTLIEAIEAGGARTPHPLPTISVVVPATDLPSTLPRCRAAIESAAQPPEELLVVDGPPGAGPAEARNLGAARARGEILVFIDADVEVHEDALARVRHAFARDEELVALFGSYDDSPDVDGLVSAFRNLLHHHVHRSSAGPAETFWTGLGAIRRETFLASGGFDASLAMLEDVDLGMRLREARARIALDPGLLGTHLKCFSLYEMIRSDLLDRGVPWVELLLRSGRISTTLNLGWRHRLSAVASLVFAVALAARRPARAAPALGALVILNRSFYSLLWRRRGPLGACAGVALHVVHHLTAALALPLGVLVYMRRRRSASRSAREPRASRAPAPSRDRRREASEPSPVALQR